jgi:hypothetical protein
LDTEDDETLLEKILKDAGPPNTPLFSPVWQTVNSAPLSKADFDTAVDMIFRDHGIFGRHSLRCVYIQEEGKSTDWCCALDCGIANRTRQRGQDQASGQSEDHSDWA